MPAGPARIRHWYVERAPALAPTLVHSTHDDRALLSDKALRPSHWQSFMSTAGMVSAIMGAIAGVFAAVAARAALGTVALPVALGVLAFGLSVFLSGRYHVRAWVTAEGRMDVLFPSPPGPRG